MRGAVSCIGITHRCFAQTKKALPLLGPSLRVTMLTAGALHWQRGALSSASLPKLSRPNPAPALATGFA